MPKATRITNIHERGMRDHSPYYETIIHCLKQSICYQKKRFYALNPIRERFYQITEQVNPYNENWPPLTVHEMISLLYVVAEEVIELENIYWEEVKTFTITCNDVIRLHYPHSFNANELNDIQLLINELQQFAFLVQTGEEDLSREIRDSLQSTISAAAAA